MIAEPPLTPVTTPPLTVAIRLLELLQLPPVVVSLSVVVEPTHNTGVPVITAGDVFTVTVAVLVQPVPSEYVTVATPEFWPVTTPAASTVNIDVLLLVHVPPS